MGGPAIPILSWRDWQSTPALGKKSSSVSCHLLPRQNGPPHAIHSANAGVVLWYFAENRDSLATSHPNNPYAVAKDNSRRS